MASLRGISSFICDSFNFFLDGEDEIGKELTLVRRRTSQIVERRRGSVELLAVEVQIRLHFQCQTKCFLNHCWFDSSDFPSNNRIGQHFDECGEEELVAHGIVGISFACKIMECPIKSGQILAGYWRRDFTWAFKTSGLGLHCCRKRRLSSS